MKLLWFLALCCAPALCLPAHRGVVLINRSQELMFRVFPGMQTRLPRANRPFYVKNGVMPVNVAKRFVAPNVRKGEYICKGRVCRLMTARKRLGCAECQRPLPATDGDFRRHIST